MCAVCVLYVQRNSMVVILTSFNCDCHRFDNSCLLFFILSIFFFKPIPLFSLISCLEKEFSVIFWQRMATKLYHLVIVCSTFYVSFTVRTFLWWLFFSDVTQLMNVTLLYGWSTIRFRWNVFRLSENIIKNEQNHIQIQI